MYYRKLNFSQTMLNIYFVWECAHSCRACWNRPIDTRQNKLVLKTWCHAYTCWIFRPKICAAHIYNNRNNHNNEMQENKKKQCEVVWKCDAKANCTITALMVMVMVWTQHYTVLNLILYAYAQYSVHVYKVFSIIIMHTTHTIRINGIYPRKTNTAHELTDWIV